MIPQRVTFEILAKKYAFVVEEKAAGEQGAGENDGQHNVEQHNVGTESAGHDGTHDEHNKLLHGVVRQREIFILNELDDIYLIKDGLGVNDKIVLEGIRQVRDGDEVEYEFQSPEGALNHLKYHAE